MTHQPVCVDSGCLKVENHTLTATSESREVAESQGHKCAVKCGAQKVQSLGLIIPEGHTRDSEHIVI